MQGLTVERLDHLGRDIAGMELLYERVITALEAYCQKFYKGDTSGCRMGGSE